MTRHDLSGRFAKAAVATRQSTQSKATPLPSIVTLFEEATPSSRKFDLAFSFSMFSVMIYGFDCKWRNGWAYA
jgi:hypothetical protein